MTLRQRLNAAVAAAALAIAGLFVTTAATAAVVAKVSLSRQSMDVFVNGSHYATWRVSTGKRGFGTPSGSYSVKRMVRMHYSRKYNMSPMPHSLFFRGGFAVHGTGYVGQLGRPASHGCVRLAPGNAAALYSLVGKFGGQVVIGR